MSVEDHEATKTIENTIAKVDGHYQIGSVFWKQEDPSLPFNRIAAEARLHHLKRRFSRDPDLEAKYRADIEEYVNKGYARDPESHGTCRIILSSTLTNPTNAVWFLTQLPNSTAFP